MRKLLMAAALLVATPFAPAMAAPAAPAVSPIAATQPAASSLLLVGHHRGHMRHDRRHWGHKYRPGRGYHRPPPGWRRYHARPHNWRARGCVVVGNVWFCR